MILLFKIGMCSGEHSFSDATSLIEFREWSTN